MKMILNRLACLLKGHIRGEVVKGLDEVFGFNYMTPDGVVKVSVRKGKPEMKGEVFDAVVVRVRKPYRRLNGERICFTDNAVALLKDEKANPKGTQIEGPVAREVSERWKEVSKIASVVV